MLKRLFALFTVVAIVISLFVAGPPVFASESKGNVIYQKEEITDLDDLLKRAKNNITDVSSEDLPDFAKQTGVFKGEKGSIESETFETTQLLSKEILPQDEIKQSFVTTVFSDIKQEQLATTSGENQFIALPSADKGGDEWDDSIGVRAHSRIYYSTSTYQGVPHVDLTRVSGGWEHADSSLTLSNRRLNYGAEGPSKYGYAGSGQSTSRNLTSNSYNYYTPAAWLPISTVAGYYQFGMNSWVTIKRNSSSWTHHFQNQL